MNSARERNPCESGAIIEESSCTRQRALDLLLDGHIRGNINVGTTGKTMFSREHALDPAPFWILGRNGVHTN